eukprot:CAMPEP_0172745606 /NCGR_PEP_ID=MMETSP1074-20121228/138342_1 /TAXON_ID=2916 /ORGANISM="Ceratium fusus, Strain PA161109" /LENGTH=34 /DNA_ID= /DNA_START= /DNA_END= /DNA_ORIENTATION=
MMSKSHVGSPSAGPVTRSPTWTSGLAQMVPSSRA